jgi:hypothetical protein
MGAVHTYARPIVRVVRPNPVQRGWVALATGGRKRVIHARD